MTVCDKHRYIFIVLLPLIATSVWIRVDEYFASLIGHTDRVYRSSLFTLSVRLERLRKCIVFQ